MVRQDPNLGALTKEGKLSEGFKTQLESWKIEELEKFEDCLAQKVSHTDMFGIERQKCTIPEAAC